MRSNFENNPLSKDYKFQCNMEASRIGIGGNTVSRVLFRKRRLTEFCSKLGDF